MKNFKLVFGLVFVILMSSVSCSEDQLDEDTSYELKETRLQENDSLVPSDIILDAEVDPDKSTKGN